MSDLNVLDLEISPPGVPQTETKPLLDSFDSGQECSLDHLRELRRLLEDEDHELDGYSFDDSCLRVA